MKDETKAKWRQVGLFSLTVIICAAVFTLASIGVFWQEGGKAQTEKSQSGEPYAPPPPENTTILFLWEEGGGEIVYLDFQQNKILITILPENCDENAALVYGYRDFEAVKANSLLISGLVDRLNGIELKQNGETLRFTGAQVVPFLWSDRENFALKRQVISAIFEKIAISGFSNKDFMFIINNSNTTLSFPDCYGFEERMAALAGNVQIIN